MSLKLLQFGDVAVLDISAVTVEQDETTAKRVPSAESKGLLLYILILCRSSFGDQIIARLIIDMYLNHPLRELNKLWKIVKMENDDLGPCQLRIYNAYVNQFT